MGKYIAAVIGAAIGLYLGNKFLGGSDDAVSEAINNATETVVENATEAANAA